MDDLPKSDVVEVGRLRLTSGPRTTFDGMRRAADLVEAVVFVDQMTHAEIVTGDEVRGYVDERPGWRGAARARRAVDLGDPMARNAWETRVRMVWMLAAGLPRPRCNPPVFDGYESLLGHPDLLDMEAGVVIEYDGSGHRRARQHDRDNLREERFERHGLVVMRVTRLDLDHVADLVARMRSTRARGLARDRRRDRWTLDIPPSWGAMDAF